VNIICNAVARPWTSGRKAADDAVMTHDRHIRYRLGRVDAAVIFGAVGQSRGGRSRAANAPRRERRGNRLG